jgi:hypothetical protein
LKDTIYFRRYLSDQAKIVRRQGGVLCGTSYLCRAATPGASSGAIVWVSPMIRACRLIRNGDNQSGGGPKDAADQNKGTVIMERNTSDQNEIHALTIEELDGVVGGKDILTTVVNAVVDGINALLGRGTECTSKSCVTY